jgi:HEAT repeat protein
LDEPAVGQRCVWALFDTDEEQLTRHDLIKVLAKVLDETTEGARIFRCDVARLLAFTLHDKAPDKVSDLLLAMLKDESLKVFKKTDADIDSTPDESRGGSTAVKEDLGGDARYMAAEAIGQLGSKGKDNPDIIAALRKAADDKEAKLKETARKALEKLGIEK